jgi:hypothetical protein
MLVDTFLHAIRIEIFQMVKSHDQTSPKDSQNGDLIQPSHRLDTSGKKICLMFIYSSPLHCHVDNF